MVLADRGFTIHVEAMFCHSDLNIPAFTEGESQLDPVESMKTRNLTNVRIHAELIIGLSLHFAEYTFNRVSQV